MCVGPLRKGCLIIRKHEVLHMAGMWRVRLNVVTVVALRYSSSPTDDDEGRGVRVMEVIYTIHNYFSDFDSF